VYLFALIFFNWGVTIDDAVAAEGSVTPPFINPKMLIRNKITTQFDGDGAEKTKTTLVDVTSCCSLPDEESNSNSNKRLVVKAMKTLQCSTVRRAADDDYDDHHKFE